MKREELIAMGISEENVEKIIADYGSAVQREQAKAAELKAKADSADELQKKLDEMEAGNLTELEISRFQICRRKTLSETSAKH